MPREYHETLLMAFYLRMVVLGIGALTIFWGYRLFIAGFAGTSVTAVEIQSGGRRLSFKTAAPGTAFCMFGVVLITAALLKPAKLGLEVQQERMRGDQMERIQHKIEGHLATPNRRDEVIPRAAAPSMSKDKQSGSDLELPKQDALDPVPHSKRNFRPRD